MTRLADNVVWACKNHEANHFYCLYGFDIEGSSDSDFIDYRSFMTTRNVCNRSGKLDAQIILLRDKFLFYKYMKSNGMPVPEVFAFVRNGIVYDMNFEVMPLEIVREKKDYFVKDLDGECASYVKHISDYQEFESIGEHIAKGTYILQKRLFQCDKINVLNPKAINTLRVVTINKDGNPYVLTALLRVGTAKTGNVDNWAAGGLAIGVEKDGFLKEYGFYKPTFGLKAEKHPDTDVIFREFQIPEYQNALDMACTAHKYFYGIHSIGWDIAFSENGPVFIEGNDNWEISLMQACDRPLKSDWNEAIKQ